VSATDPLSSVLDDVLRLDKILSTDGGVSIIDQICVADFQMMSQFHQLIDPVLRDRENIRYPSIIMATAL
jgi:hypothetical protein